jgi:hypothetical protein
MTDNLTQLASRVEADGIDAAKQGVSSARHTFSSKMSAMQHAANCLIVARELRALSETPNEA